MLKFLYLVVRESIVQCSLPDGTSRHRERRLHEWHTRGKSRPLDVYRVQDADELGSHVTIVVS